MTLQKGLLWTKALEPFTQSRGIDWEVQIDECDVRDLFRCCSISGADIQRVLWNENGLNPSLPGAEAENERKAQNRAVPY